MDSSRTALRLGAKTSTILYRRGPDEMVVDEEEQHETRFEGVQFEYFASPVEVLAGPDGKVNGMVFQRTRLGPPDASGRRSAEPIPGSEFTVPPTWSSRARARHRQQRPRRVRREAQPPRRRHGYPQRRRGRVALVVADQPLNGTTPKTERTADELPVVRVQPRQRLHQRRHFGTTSDGVFAVGDFVTGPATIIEAAGLGRRARARSIAGWRACAARSSRSCRSSTAPSSPRASSTTCRASTRRRAGRRSRWRHRRCAATSRPRRGGYDTRAIAEGRTLPRCNHNINIDGPRCILCGLCADVCPEGVIYMVDKGQVGGDDRSRTSSSRGRAGSP